ncbi:MAG: hypothetical protein AB7N76_01950 [Planctomycetota bacterium]
MGEPNSAQPAAQTLEEVLEPGERVVWTGRPDHLADVLCRAFPVRNGAAEEGCDSPGPWLFMAFYYGLLLGMTAWPLSALAEGALRPGKIACVFALVAPIYALVVALHAAEVLRRLAWRYYATDRGHAIVVDGGQVRVKALTRAEARGCALCQGRSAVFLSQRRAFARARELNLALGQDPGPEDPLQAALRGGEAVVWIGRPALLGRPPQLGCVGIALASAVIGVAIVAAAWGAAGGSGVRGRVMRLGGTLLGTIAALPSLLLLALIATRLRTRVALTDQGAAVVVEPGGASRVPPELVPSGVDPRDAAEAALRAAQRAGVDALRAGREPPD